MPVPNSDDGWSLRWHHAKSRKTFPWYAIDGPEINQQLLPKLVSHRKQFSLRMLRRAKEHGGKRPSKWDSAQKLVNLTTLRRVHRSRDSFIKNHLHGNDRRTGLIHIVRQLRNGCKRRVIDPPVHASSQVGLLQLRFLIKSPDMYLATNLTLGHEPSGGMDLAAFITTRSNDNYPESAILAHSHLLVQHLLKQLEQHRRDRGDRQRRPEWLTVFVHQTAALFEPMKGVGRVGSQCEYTSDGWEARLYLGSTEIVGGKDDGHFQLIGFELDFSRLTESFTRLDEFRWSVGATADGSNSSFVTLRGQVDDNKVSLKIYSRPPKEAGPAFRMHTDGSVDSAAIQS